MMLLPSKATGQQSFVADLKRGYWSSASDFIYAGVSLAFRLDMFALSWMSDKGLSLSSFIPTYLISMALYVVPLMTVKSFMGQFSSSGFISSLRLCPIFKGLGYVSLLLNICTLVYHSIYAMIPIVYLCASFKPTLPWSCDGAREWTQQSLPLCESGCVVDCFKSDVASHLYFDHLYKDFTLGGKEFSFAWPLALSSLAVWAVVAFIVLRFSTEKIGLLIRYSVWFLIASLLVLIVRFSFLAGATAHYGLIFSFDVTDFKAELFKIPIYGLYALGPGWGLFISLASFNRFSTNINRYTWLIVIGQMFILSGMDMLEKFMHLFYYESMNNKYVVQGSLFQTFYQSSGSVLATMALPNLWSILYYAMFSTAAIILMILQLHSILSSIFDEFVMLRKYRKSIALILVAIMAIISLKFCTKSGMDSKYNLLFDTIISQSVINFILILIVTWIYGRVRFQRDMTFMTGTDFATWKVYVLRFFVPLCLMAVLNITIFMFLLYAAMARSSSTHIDFTLWALSWLAIPVYAFYFLYRSQGSLKERFSKWWQPTDWYPVEAEERQRYETQMRESNVTHPL